MTPGAALEEQLDLLDHGQVPVAVKAATAAAMLDCTRQHIYELVARGQLRKVNIGRLSRIPVEDIYRLAQLEPPLPSTVRLIRPLAKT